MVSIGAQSDSGEQGIETRFATIRSAYGFYLCWADTDPKILLIYSPPHFTVMGEVSIAMFEREAPLPDILGALGHIL